jgi:hypothetical protein
MSLEEAWEVSSATPYYPLVSKDWQFFIGFALLLTGMKPCTGSVTIQLLTGCSSSSRNHWSLRPESVFLQLNNLV